MSAGLAALRAFSAPLGYVAETNIGADRTIAGAASRQGVPSLGTELGGSGHVTRGALRIAERGVNNLLVHLGILPQTDHIAPDGPTRILEVGGGDYFVYTPEPGVFEPLVELATRWRPGSPPRASTSPRPPGPTGHRAFRPRRLRAVQAPAGPHGARRLSVPPRDRSGSVTIGCAHGRSPPLRHGGPKSSGA